MLPPSTVAAVHEFAAELLAACEVAVAGTVGGAIDRAFISPGLPALDCCPQLTAHCTGVSSLSAPGGPGQTGVVQRRNIVSFLIQVSRCSPVAEQPLPADLLETVAAEVMEDVWAVWNHLMAEIRAGALFGGKCEFHEFGPASPIDPAGGCAGWNIPVRVVVGGIPVSGS